MLSHPFFSGVDITGILNKDVKAPYVPPAFEISESKNQKLTELIESHIPQDRQAKVDSADFKDFA